MASIESLLNPLPDASQFSLPSPAPTSSDAAPCSEPRQKKPKIAKDAPIFNRGKIRGELRYPPCEERDEALTQAHRKFQLQPMGDIAEYPRHIPYNSDKKTFQEKTGRESFEVFQYTFKIPGQEKQWTVTWDYNIGLVRTTHLFKCQQYSKTTPAKVLNANPGLRDICHSITGGALAAQGYWMPFETAKAVAATFCWNIRHALTPLFGVDFPSLCVPPTNTSQYGHMLIDRDIVQKATDTANYYRMLELHSPEVTSLPPILHHNTHPHGEPDRSASSLDCNTPDTYNGMPNSPIRNTFTPVNTPCSTEAASSSPRQVLAALSRVRSKTNDDSGSEGTHSSTPYSESMDTPTEGLSDTDDEYHASDGGDGHAIRPQDTTTDDDEYNIETRARKYRSALFAREVKAAHALLSLCMQEATGSDEEYVWVDRERKRRRASA
ncbi:APSES transcription factor Xbp1 [Aspergillus nomiae NRRL 13137]|uniref:APSES transcription factor Xbp1 n=1 Tax=Aspergillus nomiae NRRL (strain ATCC 15546 / NRRL 13137 / CBS 260.88 / M93) TaxID=1509407 RepID=A0A0L1J0J0_ASPN3|nr:APSES transcription factor Xbp1 [Aspergillus nomiae NRRL 13137]KNG85175.1 APSES transcription factor Xbp1 [Aspergillus nomiae NRRL 13137]